MRLPYLLPQLYPFVTTALSSYIVPRSRCLLDFHTQLRVPLDVDYHINLHIWYPVASLQRAVSLYGMSCLTTSPSERFIHSAHRQSHCSTGQVSWARPDPSSGP